jgi:hypothetical protein
LPTGRQASGAGAAAHSSDKIPVTRRGAAAAEVAAPQPGQQQPTHGHAASMLTPSVFTNGSAACAARPWGNDGSGLQTEGSLSKQRLLSPGSSDSGGSDLIPAGAAAAADTPRGDHQQQQQQQQHSGLHGASPPVAAAATALDALPFEALCNGGWRWTVSNWPVKLYRWLLGWYKQLYLLLVTLSLPTNHLMVRVWCGVVRCGAVPP